MIGWDYDMSGIPPGFLSVRIRTVKRRRPHAWPIGSGISAPFLYKNREGITVPTPKYSRLWQERGWQTKRFFLSPHLK